jgi:hypothetical protein
MIPRMNMQSVNVREYAIRDGYLDAQEGALSFPGYYTNDDIKGHVIAGKNP